MTAESAGTVTSVRKSNGCSRVSPLPPPTKCTSTPTPPDSERGSIEMPLNATGTALVTAMWCVSGISDPGVTSAAGVVVSTVRPKHCWMIRSSSATFSATTGRGVTPANADLTSNRPGTLSAGTRAG